MQNQNTFIAYANKLSLFLVALFTICFAWYFIRPVGQELHLTLFKMSYFGFNGMNTLSFISGAIQTYIWGYIFAGLAQVIGCCNYKNN